MRDAPHDLVSRCLAGDQRAWATLVDQYAGLVYSIPRKLGLASDLCDDVAQVVFALLARRLHTLRDSDRLAGWLATTARRESARVAQRWRRLSPLRDELVREDISDQEQHELERAHWVRRGVRRLDPRCRELFETLFLRDPAPSYAEAALELGLSAGSIGPLRQRCLARLEQLLREDANPP